MRCPNCRQEISEPPPLACPACGAALPQPEKSTRVDISVTQDVDQNLGQITGVRIERAEQVFETTFTEEAAYNVAGLPNPYLGLSAFTYADRSAFGGRELSVCEAQAKLTAPGAQQTVLFITGASGCGKSSFAQAGLLPALEDHYQERRKAVARAVFRPSANPLAMLADALGLLGLPELAVQELERFTPAEFSLFLAEHTPPDGINLLVIDQFEECFTQSAPAQRAVLFGFLAGLASFDSIRTHILVTLRSDFLKELFEYPELWEIAKRGVELRAMSVEALQTAIQQPLWAAQPRESYAGKRFEPGLLERLAQDASQEAAYLPLLQTSLQELWKGGRLTLERYTGLADAVRRQAEAVYRYTDHEAPVPQTERPPEERQALLHIFLDLVEVSLDDDPARDVRRSRPKAFLVGHDPRRERLVDELIGARLLSAGRVVSPEGPVETVDIIHETLIARWDRLREAVAEARQTLRQRALFEQHLREWLGHARADGYLLSGVRLAEARQLDAQGDIALQGQQAQAFLRHSNALAEAAQRRRVRLISLVAAGLSILLLIALVAAGVAIRQQALSRSRELAAVALNQIDVDPEQALLIAIQANKSAYTYQSEDALRRSLLAMNLLSTLRGHEDAVYSAVFSPDGQRVVTGSNDGTARIWDAGTGRELAVLRGHEDYVNTAVFSPDGRWVLTADEDVTARLWDAQTGRELAVLRGHEGPVYAASFSPDGQLIVTASWDATARLWDAETAREQAVLSGHEGIVDNAAFSPDGKLVLTAGTDGTARLWDAQTGRELSVLRGHEGWVWSAAFSPDGERVVTAGEDGTARLWDVEPGREQVVLRGHLGPVYNASFSPDGRRVVTPSWDGTARLWDAETGREQVVLRGHPGPVYIAVFSPDGRWVLTAGEGVTALLWDAQTGGEVAALRGNQAWVNSATFSPDGKHVLTACSDGTAQLWDAQAGWEQSVLRGHEGRVNSANFLPDGGRMLTVGDDGTARLWDAQSGREQVVLRGHTGPVYNVSFLPDGRRMLTAGADGTARLWDVEAGREVVVLRGHTGPVYNASFSPDGRRVLTTGEDGTARLWDGETGGELAVLRGHEDFLYSAFFSPDGQRVVTASADGTARLWDAQTGQEQAVLRVPENSITSAVFSPNGKMVLTSGWDGTARLWDAETGQEQAVLSGHGDSLYNATFSPDGAQVVTAGWDATARLWDVKTGREQVVLRGHTGALSFVSFSPDGRRVVTASDDGTARLWDAQTGHELTVLRGHEGQVTSAFFSPDGRRVVTAGDDGTARVYLVHIEDLITLAQSRVTRQLTAEERATFLNEPMPTPAE